MKILNETDLSEDILVTIFTEPRILAGTKGATCPLGLALCESWDSDAHITQYVSPLEARLGKNGQTDNAGIKFSCMFFDYDFAHHFRRPKHEDWIKFAKNAANWDPKPNVIYSTRGGARAVYLTQDVFDGVEFEERYITLYRAVEHMGEGADYYCDKLGDWTRMMRLPYVMRCDDFFTEKTKSQIVLIHSGKIFPDRTKRKIYVPKPVNMCGKFKMNIKMAAMLNEITPGQRNTNLYACTCKCIDLYGKEACMGIDMLVEKARSEDLPENEIQSAVNSACKKKGYDYEF